MLTGARKESDIMWGFVEIYGLERPKAFQVAIPSGACMRSLENKIINATSTCKTESTTTTCGVCQCLTPWLGRDA